MATKSGVFLLLWSLCLNQGIFCRPNEEFPFHAILDDAYALYWRFTEEDITFEVHVETTGWAGFGISPTGSMPGADIVIGWIDENGEPHFDDRHGVGTVLPPIDQQQDWFLLQAEKTESHLILRFMRKIDLCNEEDLPIEEGTMRVIWAFNPNNPAPGSQPAYHGAQRRGTRSLQLLLHGDPDEDLPDDVITMEFKMPNITLPAQDTYYYCQFFKFPPLEQKLHVIRFEPIFTEGTERFLHHMLVYRCRGEMGDQDEIGHECWVPNMPPEMANCDVFQFAWAIGEEGINFPLHTGLPFDPEDHPGVIFVEIHYDNPELVPSKVDSSGIRLFLTPTLREFDTGVFATGTMFYPLWPVGNLAIPPHAKSFRLYNHCPSDCLQKAMDEDGLTEVKVYGICLHSHLAASKVSVRHFRNGEELEPWITDNNYDFNYQIYVFFKEEITVLPTDKIETLCEWNTLSRDNMTFGGFASTDEMCQAYILHYPQMYMTQCWTEPTPEYQLKLVNATTEPAGGYPGYQVTSPPEYVGMNLHQILSQLDWTDPCLRDELQKLYSEGDVESWAICTTKEDGWRRDRRNFQVLSDIHAEEPVCGWQDNSEEEVCEDTQKQPANHKRVDMKFHGYMNRTELFGVVKDENGAEAFKVSLGIVGGMCLIQAIHVLL